MEYRGWMIASGALWLLGGVFLLYKGVSLIGNSWFLIAAVLLGFVKGRVVFAKTVQKMAMRIAHLPQPIRLFHVYPWPYWCLIGVMMGMGVVLRFFPDTVRGIVDVAVGSALVQGAMLYFRVAAVKRSTGVSDL
jgi:hypothetical protein